MKHFAILYLCLCSFTVTADDTKDANQLVDTLHAALIESMQANDQLNMSERQVLLEPAISASFDFPEISRIVIGRYWKKLTSDEKESFINAFRQLSIATYSSRFDSFSGESFQQLGTESLKKSRILVKNALVKADGSKISMNYLVHPREGNWLILNVIADGISDLSLKRAEYSVILKAKGFKALLGMIEQKVAEANAGSK